MKAFIMAEEKLPFTEHTRFSFSRKRSDNMDAATKSISGGDTAIFTVFTESGKGSQPLSD